MKVWYTLGVNGVRVFSIKESLKTLSEKVVDVETESGTATFTFNVRNRFEARKVIAKIDRWLSNQDWYNDDTVTFSTRGLMSENDEEWVCDECSDGIDGCECNTLSSSPKKIETQPSPTPQQVGTLYGTPIIISSPYIITPGSQPPSPYINYNLGESLINFDPLGTATPSRPTRRYRESAGTTTGT